MSEPKERFDPISIVLVIAVALLGVMTWLDSTNRDTLRAQIEVAKGYKRDALQPCQVEAVGTRGRGLLVSCPGRDIAATQSLAAPVLGDKGPQGFTSVAFRDATSTIVCPVASWPEKCGEPDALHDRAFYQKAKRRRVKTSQ